MYTKFKLNVYLDEDTLSPVVTLLQVMCGKLFYNKQKILTDLATFYLPGSDFFELEVNEPEEDKNDFRVYSVPDVFYISNGYEGWHFPIFEDKRLDNGDLVYHLKVSCYFKHYHNEIQRLLNWLGRWVVNKNNQQVGIYQSEEQTYPRPIIFYAAKEEKHGELKIEHDTKLPREY